MEGMLERVGKTGGGGRIVREMDEFKRSRFASVTAWINYIHAAILPLSTPGDSLSTSKQVLESSRFGSSRRDPTSLFKSEIPSASSRVVAARSS